MMSIYPFDTILLGSKSPRRKQLLEATGLEVKLVGSEVEEIYPDDLSPKDVPAYLAELKMSGVNLTGNLNEVIITADTIVIYKDEVLGKPKTLEQAKQFLKQLSADTHTVITGVCIRANGRSKTFAQTTRVELYPLTIDEIDYYVHNYPVLDKAGAYGIQDWIGLTKIKSISGSYNNIVGLPVAATLEQACLLF